MHHILELEGRLIAIETKEIEINGNPVLTPGKIVVYDSPDAAEHLPGVTKTINGPVKCWYQPQQLMLTTIGTDSKQREKIAS